MIYNYVKKLHRDEKRLELTVYGGEGCEAAPGQALRKLRGCLARMQDSFGVQYRFEIECEKLGEKGWFPLNDVRELPAGKVWASDEPEPEPEPELRRNLSPHPPPEVVPSMQPPRFPVLPMAERQYDFFINHCQKSGQDQCKTLYLELERAGAKVIPLQYCMIHPWITVAIQG